jgi:predicted phosphohydrolase
MAKSIIKIGNHIWGMEVVETEKNWQIISYMNGSRAIEVVWRNAESRADIIGFADILTRYWHTTVDSEDVVTVAAALNPAM